MEYRVRGDPWHFLRGLWMLLRFVPVLSWSMAALLLGVAAALARGPVDWFHVVLMYAGAILVQGFVAHAYNDITDWTTGTDLGSPKLISGGSKVIPEEFFRPRTLGAIGAATLLLAVAIGLYFMIVRGPWVLAIVAVGLYAGVFYTTRPLATAYRPFVGEWLTALPAMVACTVGAYYILTGTVAALPLALGAIHGLMCIGWLMNHHIPDMEADAGARPPKVTSVVWVRDHLGLARVPWVGTAYFLVAAAVATGSGLLLDPILLVAVPFAILGAGLAWTTHPGDILQTTRRQVRMIQVTVANAMALAMLLVLGGW